MRKMNSPLRLVLLAGSAMTMMFVAVATAIVPAEAAANAPTFPVKERGYDATDTAGIQSPNMPAPTPSRQAAKPAGADQTFPVRQRGFEGVDQGGKIVEQGTRPYHAPHKAMAAKDQHLSFPVRHHAFTGVDHGHGIEPTDH